MYILCLLLLLIVNFCFRFAGRPIIFNLCGWNPWYAPVGASLANSWRTSGDDVSWDGVMRNIDDAVPLWTYAGPGGFNDPDYLLGTDASGKMVQFRMSLLLLLLPLLLLLFLVRVLIVCCLFFLLLFIFLLLVSGHDRSTKSWSI